MAMQTPADEVNAGCVDERNKMTVEQVALGFIDVANEAMCRPIRALTQARGFDTSQHVLACFGGAGGQHACAIARQLGMRSVFVHRYAGILSAYGLALADVVHEAQEPCQFEYCAEKLPYFDGRLEVLSDSCRQKLRSQGFTNEQIITEPYLHMRYDRTDCALMCAPDTGQGGNYGDFEAAFLRAYQREFGFTLPGRKIIVDDIRIRGIGRSGVKEVRRLETTDLPDTPPLETKEQCYFKGGFVETNVHRLDKLLTGHRIKGPAIIIDQTSTIVVEPSCLAEVTSEGDVRISIGAAVDVGIGTELDAIQLSIFSHRFMSIAEQMGRVLQRTAISTNIKERLDFSCALFDAAGGLIANAPHIPVHLGGMQATVQFQLRNLGVEGMQEGDVILCNHPVAGGSHLPDLTVITPVYYNSSAAPVLFVANRGHHADIGGLVPGSMPPHSTSLAQEGARFVSFKLVQGGVLQETALIEALLVEPAKVPGCSGTRNLSDNLSDLKAQIAANQKGVTLMCELIDCYGLDVVQAYMGHIQANAETAVRAMLKEMAAKARKLSGEAKLTATDYMDDGTPIKLTVEIDETLGEARFDFAGTGPRATTNSCNAPPAVTMAAVIYCLRCLVGHDIPLNQGCLTPIVVVLPSGSLLDAGDDAAVVGGNVLTSQRIVDVILRAFHACAASQGCMNNVTWGDETSGYYETVGGGAGAGVDWHGQDGVHTHMTNTRITDPEILELRYPVVLKRFEIRCGSGGQGGYRGGNGLVREYLFRKNLTLSLLTERRIYSPYGMEGGNDGEKGRNTLTKIDGKVTVLPPKISVEVGPGDSFLLETPGGGGYGKSSDN